MMIWASEPPIKLRRSNRLKAWDLAELENSSAIFLTFSMIHLGSYAMIQKGSSVS